MRQVQSNEIVRAIRDAVIQANTRLPQDITDALEQAFQSESSERARGFLKIILENAELACSEGLALCQDTGMVVVEAEMGQQVQIEGEMLESAINQGIREGYHQGFFRKSVVRDPFKRINTKDNTPAIIHTRITAGDNLRISVLPKGAGSENMGQIAMLKPSHGIDGVKEFVLKVVRQAGANSCPPVIVGVGVGGNMEKAALLAKKALLRPVNERNSREDIKLLEEEMLKKVNALGIGPQGMGGDTTALAVNIETYPTHIACLPVAVSLGCHSTRRVTVNI